MALRFRSFQPRQSGKPPLGPRPAREGRLIEIGERLREARVQRELEVADAAAQLKLHPKYLRAIEWERFDRLDPRDAKKYVRSYAELLGVDAKAYLDRYESGLAEYVPRRPAGTSRYLGVTSLIAGFVFAAAVLGVGWQLSRDESQERASAPVSPSLERAASAVREPLRPTLRASPGTRAVKERAVMAPTRVAVVAPRGDSWIEARSGSADGELLYNGLLEQGRSISLSARRVWMRLGAASNLDVTVNGKRVGRSLFGTVDVTFGPRPTAP